MRYDEEAGEFVLESGRRLRSHGDLLAVDESDGWLYYGYDGSHDPEAVADGKPFTPEERAEIADYVIAKWQAWKVWRP